MKNKISNHHFGGENITQIAAVSEAIRWLELLCAGGFMLQMRWAKPDRNDEDTPKGVVIGWPENGHDYMVLQFREVIEFDEYGEVKTATNWQTVRADI